MATSETSGGELPPDAVLLWGERQRPAPGPKPGLSVQVIVETAIAIADDEGLPALSMKKLAQHLGCGTMSLYRYVPGKDQLVELMFDTAIGPPAFPDAASAGWREVVTGWAHATRDFYLRHPWALHVATGPRMMGPNEVAWVERVLDALHRVGVPAPRTGEIVMAVNGYVRGAVQPFVAERSASHIRLLPITSEGGLAPEVHQRFPALIAALEAGAFGGSGGEDKEDGFDVGLGWLVDGIEEVVPPGDS